MPTFDCLITARSPHHENHAAQPETRYQIRIEVDGVDKITEGVHERMIIAPEKFNAKLAEKKARAAL